MGVAQDLIAEFVHNTSTAINDEYVPEIQNLGEQLAQTYAIIDQDLSGVRGGIEQLRQNFSSKVGEVRDFLQTSTQEIQDLSAEAVSAAEAIRSSSENFSAEISGHLEIVKERADGTGGTVSEIDQFIGGEKEKYLSSIQDWLSQVSGSLEDFQAKKETLASAVSSLGETAEQQFTESKAQVTTLGDLVTQQAADLAQRVDDRNQSLAEGLSASVDNDVAGTLAEGAQYISEVYGDLNSLGEQFQGLIDGNIGEAMNKVEEISDILEDIKPLIDAIDLFV